MRKVTSDARYAINTLKNFKSSNTQVVVDKETMPNGYVLAKLYLHGHLIGIRATKEYGNNGMSIDRTFFCMQGWGSATTRDRLHAMYVTISQKNYEQGVYCDWHNEKRKFCIFRKILTNGVYEVKNSKYYDEKTGKEYTSPITLIDRVISNYGFENEVIRELLSN